MLDILSQDGLQPFLISGGVVFGLLIIEVVLSFIGYSSLAEIEGPNTGAVVDLPELTAGQIAADFDIDFETAASVAADIEAAGGQADIDGTTAGPATSGGILGFIGLRRLPFMVWLGLFLAGFASSGLALQVGLNSFLGVMLPASAAALIALAPALVWIRFSSAAVVRLVPGDETYAISERSLGRRLGTVTVGTARRDQPAEVRITDQHGTAHYAMLEPLNDNAEIAQGTRVLVVRLPGGILRLVDLP